MKEQIADKGRFSIEEKKGLYTEKWGTEDGDNPVAS